MHSKGSTNIPQVAGIKTNGRREAAVRRDSGVRQYVPAVNITTARQAPQINKPPAGYTIPLSAKQTPRRLNKRPVCQTSFPLGGQAPGVVSFLKEPRWLD